MSRPEQGDDGQDAGAPVSHEQMRPEEPRYPVDRYLVESSKKFEMVNIVDEDLWNPEPALRPEDEMILRKLHEMLQSTADDLKLLSGELTKYHQMGVQYKTAPTPLDEQFNEKVHIEEIVNAKFHGYKIIDKTPRVPDTKPNVTNSFKPVNIKSNVKSSGVQVNSVPVTKKLSLSRTRVIQVNEGNCDKYSNKKVLNNGKRVDEIDKVAYKEFSYKYVEPKVKTRSRPLQIQQMPSVDIRSELKEQKVLQLDILPENKNSINAEGKCKNVAVVSVQHEVVHPQAFVEDEYNKRQVLQSISKLQPTVRRISKMETCDSSSGSNNRSSEPQVTPTTRKKVITPIINLPKSSVREKYKTGVIKSKKDLDSRQKSNLDEWKKKLNDVYGPSTSHRKKSKVSIKSNAKNKVTATSVSKKINNADYIPYSKLTLGGVRVSDIEREISDIENKNIPLSPILNKILSRENSFFKDSPKEKVEKNNQNILTTSDENLLQEVIDIEKTVSETLSKSLKTTRNKPQTEEPVIENISSLSENERASYDDDFEEDKSSEPENQSQSGHSDENAANKLPETITSAHNTLNTDTVTHTKAPSLTIKESVDIFEFVHAIDTQDIAIQSTSNKITPKETQTSPRNEQQNIRPIHNDLWPSIDPRGEVEKILSLEKDFIKKLIVEEYGDILEKSLNKPSTSKKEETNKNVAAFQKNTQTSPGRVKSVMTSPARTKTRTTSPLVNPCNHNLTDQQTSPMILINDSELKIDDDLAISINLSSPRFSLRLPQNSREVFSNLESSKDSSRTNLKQPKPRKGVRITSSSTTSIDPDSSSTELSSLGEVRLKFRKFARKAPSISEFSDSSNCNSDYQTASILPLKSEGEISLGQINRRTKTKARSDAVKQDEQVHGVQMLTISKDHQYTVNEDELKHLLVRDDVKDLRVVIVTVAGDYPMGKSILLGYFLKYLQAPREKQINGQWLGDPDVPLTGFSCDEGSEKRTTGMMMWSQPLFANLPSGEKVLVVLCDTQGTFDLECTIRDSLAVLALSTLLSSVVIYNLKDNIEEDHLKHLQLFTKYAESAKSEKDKTFQTLECLVSDYPSADGRPYGQKGGEELLNLRLQVTSTMPEEKRSLREHIRSTYETVTAYLMTHPGTKVTKKGYKGNHGDLEKEFKEHLKLLAESLFSPEKLALKIIDGELVKAQDLIYYIKKYVDIFNSDRLPKTLDIAQATTEVELLLATREARELYDARMKKECGDYDVRMPQQQVSVYHEQAMLDALKAFSSKKKLGNEKDMERYLANLKQELESKLSHYLTLQTETLSKHIMAADRAYYSIIQSEINDRLVCLPPSVLEKLHKKAEAAAMREFDSWRHPMPCVFDQDRTKYLQEVADRFKDLEGTNFVNNGRHTERCLMAFLNVMNKYSTQDPPLDDETMEIMYQETVDYAINNLMSSRNRQIIVPDDQYRAILLGDMQGYYLNSFRPNNRRKHRGAIRAAIAFYNNSMVSFNDKGKYCLHPSDLKKKHEELLAQATKMFKNDSEPGDEVTSMVVSQIIYHHYEEFKEANRIGNEVAVATAYKKYKSMMNKYHMEAKAAAVGVFRSKRKDTETGDADPYFEKLSEKLDDAYGMSDVTTA